MKPWHYILIALFLIVIIFAIYAINQAQKTPKVIVQQSADTKAGIWDVISGLTSLFGKKDKDKDKENETDADNFVGPPTYEEYLNS